MTQKHLLGYFAVAATTMIMMGCAEKDLYDPDYGKEPLKDESEYFGFETRSTVQLSVNYGLPGFTTCIELYDEDPMETVDGVQVKKEGLGAQFKTYTDDNGKFEGQIKLPTAASTVYLYTSTWGLPRCVKLNVENGAISYDMTKLNASTTKSAPATRSYAFKGSLPYQIDTNRNLYSLCQWGYQGGLWDNANYLKKTKSVGDEKIGDFVYRIQSYLLSNRDDRNQVNNASLTRGPETTNLTLTKEASVSVTFLNRDAAFNNTFGYYYYEGNQVDVKAVKRYIVFPNVYLGDMFNTVLTCGDKVQLKYFGKDGKQAASDKFPKGCTIGWFIYSDGYDMFDPMDYNSGSDEIKPWANLITTNDATPSYIALNDKSTGTVVLGVEDGGNKSYCDLLFYAEADPQDAVIDPNRPPTDPTEPEKPDETEKISGTLAFEDIWPTGGDYDMNDVIVEYVREVTFNSKNTISQIVDTFTPVWDGAVFKNAFAYQIDNDQFGKITSATSGIKQEPATSSILICPNVKVAIGKSYSITREFNNISLDKKYLKEYNPYIIVKYVEGQKDRTEVHLPKHKATSLVNMTLIGANDDAYYIDRKGSYPFAIDIPITGFVPVTEKSSIDSEYPDFKKWADSYGKECADWYKNYKAHQ